MCWDTVHCSHKLQYLKHRNLKRDILLIIPRFHNIRPHIRRRTCIIRMQPSHRTHIEDTQPLVEPVWSSPDPYKIRLCGVDTADGEELAIAHDMTRVADSRVGGGVVGFEPAEGRQ